MVYKVLSNKSLEEVKENFENRAKEYGFSVLKRYDFKKILEEKGFETDKDVTVFEICKPEGALKVLDTIIEMSAFMPCRVSIYQEEEKVVLATIDFENILKDLDVDSNFKEYIGTLYAKFIELMNSFK